MSKIKMILELAKKMNQIDEDLKLQGIYTRKLSLKEFKGKLSENIELYRGLIQSKRL